MFPFWHVKSEFTKVKVSSMTLQILDSDDGQNVPYMERLRINKKHCNNAYIQYGITFDM